MFGQVYSSHYRLQSIPKSRNNYKQDLKGNLELWILDYKFFESKVQGIEKQLKPYKSQLVQNSASNHKYSKGRLLNRAKLLKKLL